MNAIASGTNSGIMKAIVSRTYGSAEVLRLEEVGRPEPADGEVLIRNHASVVSSAECQARAADPAIARLHFGLLRPKWPVLGATFSGVVDAGPRSGYPRRPRGGGPAAPGDRLRLSPAACR